MKKIGISIARKVADAAICVLLAIIWPVNKAVEMIRAVRP